MPSSYAKRPRSSRFVSPRAAFVFPLSDRFGSELPSLTTAALLLPLLVPVLVLVLVLLPVLVLVLVLVLDASALVLLLAMLSV